MKALLAAVIVLWGSSTTVAQDVISGNHFLPACKAFLTVDRMPMASDAFDMGECVGIVSTLGILAETVNSCPPGRHKLIASP
jgi:hypothetical protein